VKFLENENRLKKFHLFLLLKEKNLTNINFESERLQMLLNQVF